jgi:hypothetical protein
MFIGPMAAHVGAVSGSKPQERPGGDGGRRVELDKVKEWRDCIISQHVSSSPNMCRYKG